MAGLQGRVFGGFQLTEQMSGGGIADVYRARPNKPGAREVVVKVIYPEFARQSGFLAHFREIVQSSARLASHPHILPLIASGEEQGYLYLVTPFVSAGTLRDRMRSGGQLGVADVAPFFRQLCDALAYAHSLGVHHDNVKPSNIFLFEGRHVLLGDFGLLWNPSMMDLDQSASGAEAVDFLAPEIMRGPGSQQADIYGVGAVLFAALTGHAPFRGSKLSDIFAAHASQQVPHLTQVNPGLPPPILALDAVIQRAMAKRPEERYPSATAVAQAIETTFQHVAPAPAPPQPFVGPGMGAQPAPPGGFTPWQMESPLGAAGFPGAPQIGGPMGGMGFPLAPGGALPLGFGQLNPPFPPLPQGPSGVAAQSEIGNLPTARVPAPGLLAPSSEAAGHDPAALATIYSPAAQMGRVLTSQGAGNDEPDNTANFGPLALPAVHPGAGPVGQIGAMSNPGFTVAGGNANWNAGSSPEAASGARQWTMTGPLGDDRFDNGTAQRIKALSGVSSNPASSDELTAWQLRQSEYDASDDRAAPGGWDDDRDGMRGDEDYSGPPHDASFAGRAASGEPYTDEYSRAQPAVGIDTGQYGRPDDQRPTDDRPFSATQLGLPRLTSPAMDGMPPSWQDIVSGKHEASAAVRQPDRGQWSSSGHGQNDDWRDESASWQAQSTADAWGDSRIGESVFAPAVRAHGSTDDAHAPWDADASAHRPAQSGRRSKKRATADDEYSAFDDDKVWTTGHTAIRHKRRRRVRKLVLLLVLVLIFDMAALMVSRPDLCPTSGCRQLSGALHQRFPILDRLTAPSALAVAAAPSALKLAVAAGQSAQSNVTVTNMGALTTTEQATASLAWISASPQSSSLLAGSNTQVTITARPPATVKAGVYTGTVTISNDKESTVISITITVSAAS